MADLFQPLKIREKEIKNRIGVPPMVVTRSDENGCVTDFEMEHYSSFAKGGAGLIIQEATCVSSNGKLCDTQLGIWEDAQIPALKKLTEKVHRHGTVFVVQIHHAGWQSVGENVDSPVAGEFDLYGTPVVRKEMSLEAAEKIADNFVEAAKRAYKAGYDGVELHAAHGYLFSELLDPDFNHRTDRIGSDPAGYIRDILSRIHRVCGKEFIAGLRIGGMSPDLDTAWKNISLIKDEADYLSISWGYEMVPEIREKMKAEHFPYEATVYAAMKIKQRLAESGDMTPVFAVSGITSKQMAQEILDTTGVDLVLIGRGHLINPAWAEDAACDRDTGKCYHCKACLWKEGNCVGKKLLEKSRLQLS